MRITIIGAGFSGSTLATELATSYDTDVEVYLVGAPATFGRGVAYGEARGEHLLNVRAGHLGADPDNHDDFAQWLNLSGKARDSFLPRIAYGEYLRDRVRLAETQTTNLTCLEHEVVEIAHHQGGYNIYLDNGSRFDTDCVVLALGALPPQRLPAVGPRLARHWRYVGWPWHEGDLERIDRDARLLIVGTGLTMADVVSTLRRRGHRGEIVAMSRHGLLPQRHTDAPADPIELPPSVLSALRATDIQALFSAVRSLSRVVPDWRAVIDALRPHTQSLWGRMSPTERERFLRHVRSHWECCRHRMPPRTADDVDALLATGQLQVRAGRLLRAGVTERSIYALIRARGAIDADREDFDALIRATGLDVDVTNTSHPLMQHLVASGMVSADPFGQGIQTSSRFAVLDEQRQPVRGLYCLGPLLRGSLWEITAIPELRAAARVLAHQLLKTAVVDASRGAAPSAWRDHG